MSKKITIDDRIHKFLDDLRYRNIVYNDDDVIAINYAFKEAYSDDIIKSKYRIYDRLMDMFLYDTERSNKDYYGRLLKTNTRALTAEYFNLRYGLTEGKKRWDSYCKKQAVSNTFEYKKAKYGMSKDEFDRYNKSRSCTKENFIARHGKIDGERRWKEYCDRQAYAGCKLEYFIEKYGEDDGLSRYNEVVRKKKHTLETVMESRHLSEEEAIKWLCDYYKKLSNRPYMYSKESQVFVKRLLSEIDLTRFHIYYGADEYGMWSKSLDSYVKYDLTIRELGLIFEYNGDFYHANPRLYRPDDVLHFGGDSLVCAKDIWNRDRLKEKTAIDNGFDLCKIWQSDFKRDPEEIIQRCVKVIKDKIRRYDEIHKIV